MEGRIRTAKGALYRLDSPQETQVRHSELQLCKQHTLQLLDGTPEQVARMVEGIYDCMATMLDIRAKATMQDAITPYSGQVYDECSRALLHDQVKLREMVMGEGDAKTHTKAGLSQSVTQEINAARMIAIGTVASTRAEAMDKLSSEGKSK